MQKFQSGKISHIIHFMLTGFVFQEFLLRQDFAVIFQYFKTVNLKKNIKLVPKDCYPFYQIKKSSERYVHHRKNFQSQEINLLLEKKLGILCFISRILLNGKNYFGRLTYNLQYPKIDEVNGHIFELCLLSKSASVYSIARDENM